MDAALYPIIDRAHAFAGAVRSLSDFTLGPGRDIDPVMAVQSPDWSLYAVDIESRRAMFVELPKGTDLGNASFVYMTQFDLAQRAIIVPLELLEPLSRQRAAPENMGMLFSTGRCGSTLASRILAQIPDVWSLSEPDILENLAFARCSVPSKEMVPLIRAATRLLFNPPAGRKIRTFVIKPRSESVLQASDYAAALPQSRNIFMYRDAAGYVNSLYRFAQKMIGPEVFFGPEMDAISWPLSSANAPQSLSDEYFPEGRNPSNTSDVMAMGWAIRMHAYLRAADIGVPMQPLHYADLNADRRAQTTLLLQGLGIRADHLDLAMRGFDEDSQKGTGGDRALPAIPLDDAQRARIAVLLGRWGLDDYATLRLPRVG